MYVRAEGTVRITAAIYLPAAHGETLFAKGDGMCLPLSPSFPVRSYSFVKAHKIFQVQKLSNTVPEFLAKQNIICMFCSLYWSHKEDYLYTLKADMYLPSRHMKDLYLFSSTAV